MVNPGDNDAEARRQGLEPLLEYLEQARGYADFLEANLPELVGDATIGADASAQRRGDLRAAAAATGPVAQLVVDSQRLLVDVNLRAQDLFDVGPADVGRPLQDLELSSRPVELRGPLDRACAENHPVSAGQVEWGESGQERILAVDVTPISSQGRRPMGAAITFADVTDYARLASEHGHSKRELEAAYEELQSTVEELETTNEELRAASEELETTSQELRAASEELQTTNEELHRHAEELDRLDLLLEVILGNLGVGVVVVDRDCRVRLWNANSEDLWGLSWDEVEGEDLLSLDIGLPLKELKAPLDAATASPSHSSSELLLDAVNRRGSPFKCEVRVTPLASAKLGLCGGLVLMRAVAGSSTIDRGSLAAAAGDARCLPQLPHPIP